MIQCELERFTGLLQASFIRHSWPSSTQLRLIGRCRSQLRQVPSLPYYIIRQSSSKARNGTSRKECQSIDWIVSDTLTRKKSVFIARAAHVTSEHDARKYVQDLIATDKKASKATHNITAWRIKGQGETSDIQNSDDDGESAAGGKLLTLLQMMDAWNVMVVVTRWFGGIKLGPERFRAINSVAKDALDKGGWNKSGSQDAKKSGSGKKKRK